MKKIITLILLTISFNVYAENEVNKYRYCENISQIAGIIMKARQNGMEMQQSIKNCLSLEKESVQNLCIEIVENAYDTPRFNTENIKNTTILDFKNNYYSYCLKSF